jgi:hypothetical protein
MNIKQYRTAKKLLESFLEKQWINENDFMDLETVFEYILEGDQAAGIKYLYSLETLPREKGFNILKTIGMEVN